MLLINDSVGHRADVAVRAADGRLATGPAQLQRLSAPSASATGDITLGRRSFGTVTTTGRLRPPVPDLLAPHRGGYEVTLPPASAALLTFVSG